ncbi:MAG: urease accessory protein UreE [bacterium]
MPDLPAAHILLTDPPAAAHGVVVLGYDERLLRRKRLRTTQGESFFVDLPAVTNLDDYWGFQLDDGRTIQVLPAEEALLQITGPDLPRLAWHIGNRHTPCQIEPHRLMIRRDHVLEAMLRHLGAELTLITEPFTPEGGAYGTGRTMGHEHGGLAHGDHAHGLETSPRAPEESFGWHDHGDGRLHFHDPKR